MKRHLGKEHFAALEGIRGLAALYVVINHARGHGWAGLRFLQARGLVETLSPLERLFALLNQFTRLGHEAVILFFVLSGFSIAHSLRAECSLSRFYARRLLRLYPPKVFALGFAIVVFIVTRVWTPELHGELPGWSLVTSQDFLDPLVILKNFLYMPKGSLIVQYWSLPHEMLFYVLAPLIVRRPLALAVTAASLFGLGCVARFAQHVDGSFWLSYTCVYQFFFAIGVVTYSKYDWVVRVLPVVATKRRLIAVASAVIVGSVAVSARYGSSRITETIAAGFAVLLIVAFVEQRIGGRFLEWLGERSYSLYLIHVATIILVMAAAYRFRGSFEPIRSPAAWLLLVPVCLVVAEVCFRIIERPSRRWVAALRTSTLPAAEAAATSAGDLNPTREPMKARPKM